MRNDCEIVKDLLPLYAEGMTSPSSNELIEEHLKTCKECQEALDALRSDVMAQDELSEKELPLKEFSKTFRKKKRGLAVMIAALAASIVIALYALLSTPRYLGYAQAVESTEETDGGILVHFKDDVRHIRTVTYTDPDGYETADLECWTSALDQLWKAPSAEDTLIRADKIWFRGNKDSMASDVQLYGPEEGGSKTLRRLALNFWFLAAGGLTVLGAIGGFLLRKTKAGVILQKLTLIPLSWCLASMIVERGINAATWSPVRDFSLIGLLCFFLSVFFLCFDSRRREMKAVKDL
ncbi:MAG: zf-HC2 domain-containing protein [Solobacterium sp.]|nr:zf-HC2 domain-containing protein [Solobacterium sp.]